MIGEAEASGNAERAVAEASSPCMFYVMPGSDQL
jgi:hypothetical protein